MQMIKFLPIILIFYSCKSIPTSQVDGSFIVKETINRKGWIDKESNYFFIKNIDSLTITNFKKNVVVFGDSINIKNCCRFSSNNNANRNKIDNDFEGYNFFNLDRKSKSNSRISFSFTKGKTKINYIVYKVKVNYCDCTSKYTYSQTSLNNELFIYPFKIQFIKLEKAEKKEIIKRLEKLLKP